MPDTCIVCLSDLASAAEQSEGDGQIEAFAGTAESVQPSAIQQNPNAVAKILPCKHQLHNHCLGPWVRRANSCPMCRTNFNTVELSLYKDGPCLSSFQVKDKIQAAHFDDTIALEPEIFDNLTDSCLLCEVLIASDDLLVCDTCQGAFHMACAVSTVPSSPWTCRFCCEDAGVPLNTAQRQRYRHVQHRHRVQATSDTEWASVWRAIHTQDQLDLHFPFADEEPESVPAAHRRDIEAWHRRLNAAEQQGSATRFRQNAASILESNDSLNINSGASQDEIQAWRAFETARDVENPLASSNNRSKRRSRSSSPAQPEQGSEAPRRFKRPRTRRVNGVSDVAEENRDENAILVAGPSTASAPLNSRRTDANGIGPSHFKSILQEVEKGSETSAAQPRGRSQLKINASTGSNPSSPRSLSPMTPTSRSSGQFSPCFHPDSPALSRTSRSASPPPLTSRVEPTYPQPAFYSPAPPLRNRQISDADSKVPSGSQSVQKHNLYQGHEDSNGSGQADRLTTHCTNPDLTQPSNGNTEDTRVHTCEDLNGLGAGNRSGQAERSSIHQPNRDTITASDKEEIQAIVKAALKPAYGDGSIDEDQFTGINCQVSRALYKEVGNAENLVKEKAKWEVEVAARVDEAIKMLKPVDSDK